MAAVPLGSAKGMAETQRVWERFRERHRTHLSTGERLWNTFPTLRPMATITHGTLDWYGWDEDGAGVHDVIGTPMRPLPQSVIERDGIPPLMPLEFDAGPRDQAVSAA